MRNYVQKGENITLPAAPYALKSGDGCKLGKLFGVAAGDAADTTPVDLVTTGVFSMAKASAAVFAIGAPVYWDDTAKLVTATATGNVVIGTAMTAAANPSGFVEVRLNGFIV